MCLKPINGTCGEHSYCSKNDGNNSLLRPVCDSNLTCCQTDPMNETFMCKLNCECKEKTQRKWLGVGNLNSECNIEKSGMSKCCNDGICINSEGEGCSCRIHEDCNQKGVSQGVLVCKKEEGEFTGTCQAGCNVNKDCDFLKMKNETYCCWAHSCVLSEEKGVACPNYCDSTADCLRFNYTCCGPNHLWYFFILF
jgi:hypothetical protein